MMCARESSLGDGGGARSVCRVAILGSTGSIGTQTLETIAHLNSLHASGEHPTRYEVVALAAGSNGEVLGAQARAHGDALVALCNRDADSSMLPSDRVVESDDGSVDLPTVLVERTRPDLVVGAIVGIDGLPSTLRSVELGIDVALANKESLVAGGQLVVDACARSGASLLPVDSEHAGLWQCLLGIFGEGYTPPSAGGSGLEIRRVTLTASGGPFRSRSLEEIEDATVEDALNHPTWSMGQKVTIDSATLMNKGLELIEAHWLFGLGADELDAILHPQSMVHAVVETRDHSMLAHLGPTDMRCPIQHALTHPCRCVSMTESVDLGSIGSLEFLKIDPARFPAIELAKRVIREGSSYGAVFNSANESAVRAFLNREISFGAITRIVERTLGLFEHRELGSLESVLEAHREAGELAESCIAECVSSSGTGKG